MIRINRIIINCLCEVENVEDLNKLRKELEETWEEAKVTFSYTNFDDITELNK